MTADCLKNCTFAFMELQTTVETGKAPFSIQPFERMLFVGSCFADGIGKRFKEDRFRVVVNPFGVMYNPVSILHTVQKLYPEHGFSSHEMPAVAVLTLGTNHVYVLRQTGQIVDNCMKRPQRLFEERVLSVAECTDSLLQTVACLRRANARMKVVLTVSPIRYRKYGYHNSQLSKATLMLAADEVERREEDVFYFPAYEIVNDELRDYRFYQPDMLHPSAQAVDIVWEKFAGWCFTQATFDFIKAWKPIKEALNHRPFHPESEEYRQFMARTKDLVRQLKARYPELDLGDLAL